MAWIGELVGANRLGEGDNEAEEVLASIRGVEAIDVDLRLDFLCRILKLVGRGKRGHLLGLRDRRTDDGFLSVGRREVHSRSTDGDVGRVGGGRWTGIGGGAAAVHAGSRGGVLVRVGGWRWWKWLIWLLMR